MTASRFRTASAARPSTFEYIGASFSRLRCKWTRWQAEREIAALPYDVRKDIGWPGGQ